METISHEEDTIIRLQHNENYWMLSNEDVAKYNAVLSSTFTNYPDYEPLNQALARYAGVDRQAVVATAGSDAAIRLIAERCVARRSRVLLPVPSFYGYERIFQQVGLSFDTVSYREERGSLFFPVEEIIARVQKRQADVLFLCQPNNPLGSLIPIPQVEAVLDAMGAADMLAVVDEAYFEFSGYTAKDRLGKQPLIILRTLSKAFGLAGARVGYYLAEASLIDEIQVASLPWTIAHGSVNAALIGLKRSEYFKERIREIKEARDIFSQQLQQLPGIQVYPSDTNFVFVRLSSADRIIQALAKKGILVAPGAHMSIAPQAAEIFKDGIRMTTPAPYHQKRIVTAFAEVIDK